MDLHLCFHEEAFFGEITVLQCNKDNNGDLFETSVFTAALSSS
jgi:hypothetical protein